MSFSDSTIIFIIRYLNHSVCCSYSNGPPYPACLAILHMVSMNFSRQGPLIFTPTQIGPWCLHYLNVWGPGECHHELWDPRPRHMRQVSWLNVLLLFFVIVPTVNSPMFSGKVHSLYLTGLTLTHVENEELVL